ncbi:MAG TPA: GyrI-like domain-containing protein [Gemmatimonadaceae bacterium]|nr:GyrI-like domain-containing protein [Gemmatimonadaceae bacterium]
MVQKLDYRKQLRHLYQPSAREVVEVQVPPLAYLMVDGTGDPATSASYVEALGALFAASYAIKFACKAAPDGGDYVVMPLEGLWWADDMSVFHTGRRADWRWTMMIAQPPLVTRALVERTLADVARRKSVPGLARLRYEELAEGRAAQIMHLGPYTDEGPTIQRVHEFIERAGCRRTGRHHEIYLSDPRRVDPAKLKTIVRRPML